MQAPALWLPTQRSKEMTFETSGPQTLKLFMAFTVHTNLSSPRKGEIGCSQSTLTLQNCLTED